FYPVVEDILTDYPDDVRVVLRYAAFHGEASEQAIKVLEAARMQDVFVPVLEALLEAQPEWAAHGSAPQANILEIAGGAGLDVEAASSQIMSPSTVGLMNQDRTDIETIGVSQTPTFFVNGRPLTEFGTEQLRALVDEEVARVGDN
ncbi:MAG TPA: disulfide bond formation protein DsbA, partial [Hyphomonas sp.]|nr:disulfide bond formation protein DsbA [Hyphomonas sp.]